MVSVFETNDESWQTFNMWTDTHLHLDASEYDEDRALVVERARACHVTRFVIPAVCRTNFRAVIDLAHSTPGAVYCLGIHPMYTTQAIESDLDELEALIQQQRDDPKFAGVGEIGLDGFDKSLDWTKQEWFFHQQLKLAKKYALPVVMHVRKAQDGVLKGLRRFKPISGIAHAFNGSFQQAQALIDLNMKLGFGGAFTYDRALQLRRLASQLPLDGIVLETDGPDIAPEWIWKQRNEPLHIAAIAQALAELRQITIEEVSLTTERNAALALPALTRLI